MIKNNNSSSSIIKYIKIDLHHHTYQDTSLKRQITQNKINKIKEILEIADSESVRIIVITNHTSDKNYFSWTSINDYVSEIVKKQYQITIFPGMEITINYRYKDKYNSQHQKNIDIIFGFENSKENIEKLKKLERKNLKFLEILKKIHNKNAYYEEYIDLVNEFQKEKILFFDSVHYSKSHNSLKNILGYYDNQLNQINKDFINFNFYDGKNKYNKISLRNEKNVKKLFDRGIFPTCPGTDITEITPFKFKKEIVKFDWIAINTSDSLWDNLKKISRFPAKRILTKTNDDNEKGYIVDTFIEEFREDENTPTIKFEAGLNVIIGKRGAGKSTLMQKIKYCLENPSNQKSLKIINNNVWKKEKYCYISQNDLIKQLQKFYESQNNRKKDGDKKELMKEFKSYLSEIKLIETLKTHKHQIINLFLGYISNTLNLKKQQNSNQQHKYKIILQNYLKDSFKRVLKFKQEIDNQKFDRRLLNDFQSKLKSEYFKSKIITFLKNTQIEIKQFNEVWNSNQTAYKSFKKIYDQLDNIFDAKTISENNSTQANNYFRKLIERLKDFHKDKNLFIKFLSSLKKFYNKFNNKKNFIKQKELLTSTNRQIQFYEQKWLKIKSITFEQFVKNLISVHYKKILKSEFKNFSLNELFKLVENVNNNFKAISDSCEIGFETFLGEENITNKSPGENQELFLRKTIESEIVDKSIVLLDQPSDNLDNETIKKVLIDDFIIKQNFKKQIIIITHNPKMVLNTDPTKIILVTRNRNKFFYKNIDTNLIKNQTIQALLDGNKYYPWHRFQIYDYFEEVEYE